MMCLEIMLFHMQNTANQLKFFRKIRQFSNQRNDEEKISCEGITYQFDVFSA